MDQVFSFKKKKRAKILENWSSFSENNTGKHPRKVRQFCQSEKWELCFNLTFCAFWKVDCNCVSIIQNY